MPLDPQAAREFAIEVVHKLRASGFEAYWAGGCVRDQLLGVRPKDYDVATDATPDQIREVFGRRKTIPIGAAFGVITVIGPKAAGQIEVATFREDAEYSDGRHPDSVRFSDARADAMRRDFTINGMFFDPIENRAIDFVGGEDDLRSGVIRAIGNAEDRVQEDKLRMLRGVRFAAVLDFELDAATLEVIQQNAASLSAVSPERISQELRRMLGHGNRARAVRMLLESNLLTVILPGLNGVASLEEDAPEAWRVSLALQTEFSENASFAVALAGLLRPLFLDEGAEKVDQIGVELRLTRDEIETMKHVLAWEKLIRGADSAYWPTVQRVLVRPRVDELLTFASALAAVLQSGSAGVAFCHEKTAQPIEQWNPPPLVNGGDLQRLAYKSGPLFKEILDAVRDRQLLGELWTHDAAIRWIVDEWPVGP